MAIKIKPYVDRNLLRNVTGTGWKIRIDKEGMRRLIRFLLNGGNRNYSYVARGSARVAGGGARHWMTKRYHKKMPVTIKIEGYYVEIAAAHKVNAALNGIEHEFKKAIYKTLKEHFKTPNSLHELARSNVFDEDTKERIRSGTFSDKANCFAQAISGIASS